MCEVFFLLLPEHTDMTPLLGLVSAARRERAARMRPEAALLGVCAEALTRWALRERGLAAWAAPFRADGSGKPGLPGANFSLSHTRGAVAAAVAAEPVGVDVELIRPAPLHVSDRFFTETEQKYVREHGDEGFFRVWTRKEALIKRDGVFTLTPDTLAREDIVTREAEGYVLSACPGPASFRRVQWDELLG